MHARTVQEDRTRHQRGARNHARSFKGTPEFERSSKARKKIEMRFAHLKVQHGYERMRLRGLSGARDEFHLAAIVQNLKNNGAASRRAAPVHVDCLSSVPGKSVVAFTD